MTPPHDERVIQMQADRAQELLDSIEMTDEERRRARQLAREIMAMIPTGERRIVVTAALATVLRFVERS